MFAQLGLPSNASSPRYIQGKHTHLALEFADGFLASFTTTLQAYLAGFTTSSKLQ